MCPHADEDCWLFSLAKRLLVVVEVELRVLGSLCTVKVSVDGHTGMVDDASNAENGRSVAGRWGHVCTKGNEGNRSIVLANASLELLSLPGVSHL